MNDPHFAVLLPAAGSGTRYAIAPSRPRDKLLEDVAGRSVLQRSVSLFAHHPRVSAIVIITAPDRFAPYRAHLHGLIDPARLAFTAGGRERWESVLLGLKFLSAQPAPARFVAIHDAARPLTPAAVIDEAFRVTFEKGAALPCVPESATLKRRNPDGTVAQTVDRKNLYQAQTPQCFELEKLLAAYEHLLHQNQLADATDDAQIYERLTHPVPLTPGSPLNLKITTPEDLALAQAIATLTATHQARE